MLAIVIPYYKLTFFEATLQSLADQTDKRFMVYIGDDASLESPDDLLEKYQQKFDFEYYRFEENLGGTSLVKQWERCIAMTKDEEWVMILGDDDVLGKNVVAEFYNNLPKIKSENVNVVRFSTQKIDDEGKLISEIYYHPKIENAVDFLFRKLKGGTRSTLSEYIFKQKIVLKIKFKNLPLAWYADLLGVLEFSLFGTIYTINEALLKFRLSGINITSKTDDHVLKNEATFQFYYYLLTDKKSHFNKEQSAILIDKLEKTILDNKKNLNFWIKTLNLYIRNGKFSQFFSLIFKAVKRIL